MAGTLQMPMVLPRRALATCTALSDNVSENCCWKASATGCGPAFVRAPTDRASSSNASDRTSGNTGTSGSNAGCRLRSDAVAARGSDVCIGGCSVADVEALANGDVLSPQGEALPPRLMRSWLPLPSGCQRILNVASLCMRSGPYTASLLPSA
eukprot:364163-Chlamydomonas_euryale.AAC.14